MQVDLGPPLAEAEYLLIKRALRQAGATENSVTGAT